MIAIIDKIRRKIGLESMFDGGTPSLPHMRPDTTRHLAGPERLEDRHAMDATASNILWESAALSADNESAVLANATARSLAMDVALPDASRLARGLLNGDVEIYDTSTGTRMHTIPSNGFYVSQIETSPDGKTLAVGTGAPNVRLFDANSYAEIGGFAMPGFVYSIVFRGDEIFASTSDGGAATVYDMRTRAVRTILGGANQTNYITSINDRLYGYDARGVLKEVDPASGQVLRSVNIAGGSRIDASSESGIIAMGTAEGNIVVFDENLNQLGAFHPGMGAIQHVGFDASGTRLTARSDAAGIVFIDLSNVRTGGMMTEAGRAPAGDSAAYEVGMPMTPDGTVTFVHEANSVTALKTPWEPLPPPSPESGSEQGESGIPSEVADLIEEAVRLARNGTPWRAPEAGEIISTSLAKATRVQLTPQAGEAVAFMANIFPTTSVTAHAYKGTEKIWSGAVPSDGVFSYENAEGITDVLFTSGSTTYVSNVSIVTDEAVDVPAYTLTPMNSAEFATFAARPIAQPTNMAAAAQRLDIRGAMSGTGSSESRVLLNRDQSNYTLLRMNVSNGNSRIFDVKAIRLKGLDYRQREEVEFVGLQDGFLERIDDRTWIVAPGMPATLVATLGFYQKSTFSIQVVNGLSREAIMPLLTMGKNTVDIDLLTMNDQFRTEGVFPGMTDVRQSEWPVFAKAGHRLNATYNIRNEALNGGAVGLDVYVGWYTGEPTRGTLQETFSFPLGGGETKMVSVNVTAPPKPADATSDRPIIHTVARLPNGESAVHARLGKAQKGETRVITNREGGGLNISYVSREYTAAEYDRIRRATDKALMALLNSPDERLTAVRDALGSDHIVQLLAESSAAALAAASTTTNEEATDVAVELVAAELENDLETDSLHLFHDREGIGGNPSLPADTQRLLDRAFKDGNPIPDAIAAAQIVGNDSITPRQLYAEALQWTMPTSHPLSSQLGIQQTVTGRMLTIGFMDLFTQRGNAVNQWIMAFKLQLITDIPASRLMTAVNTGDGSATSSAFKSLLREAQYGSIVDSSIETNVPNISMAEPNKTTYVSGDTHIRIRFDIVGTNAGARNVRVYDGDTLVAISGSTGYISVPIANLTSRGAMSTQNVLQAATYDLRIEATLTTNEVVSRMAPSISMHPNLPQDLKMENANTLQINGDYSTTLASTENPGQREKENTVLSLLANPQAFPLRAPSIASGTWYWNIASPYHDGPNQYHAVDLTIPGDGDAGKPVHAPAEGEVIEGGTGTDTWHTVILKHISTLPSGETFTWFTKYLHMQNVGVKNADGSVTPLNTGMVIPTDAQFGEVGTVGSGANNHHMHMSGHLDNPSSVGIDLRRILVDEFDLVVKAADAGPDNNQENFDDNITLIVEWNNSLQAFITATQSNGVNPNLILDRSPQLDSVPAHESNQYWIANSDNPNERRRVVWKVAAEEGYNDGIARWRNIDNDAMVWDGNNWIQYNLL